MVLKALRLESYLSIDKLHHYPFWILYEKERISQEQFQAEIDKNRNKLISDGFNEMHIKTAVLHNSIFLLVHKLFFL